MLNKLRIIEIISRTIKNLTYLYYILNLIFKTSMIKNIINMKHAPFSIKQTQMFIFTLHKGMTAQSENFRAERDSFGEILGILRNLL